MSRRPTPLGTTLTALLVLALAVALAPQASAHAATEPLSVETHVLSDEASGVDAFFYADGYDLYNTYVREAYHAPSDESGIIWRFDIYGGFGPVSTSSELHVDVGVDGLGDGPSARLTTTDDHNWTSGTATVVFQNTTGDGEPPFPGYGHLLQVFVPYQDLGLEPGETLQDPWMRSWADDDPVDDAPGGFYLPGTDGTPEVPDGGSSERLADEVPLDGPDGYVTVDVDAEGTIVNVTVTSQVDSTGQHVRLEVDDAAGWTVTFDEPPEVVLDPGGSHSFTFNATPDGAVDPLPVRLVSDLGGLQTFTVGTSGLSPASDEDGPAVTVAESQDEPVDGDETPVDGVIVVAGLLGAALVLRRT